MSPCSVPTQHEAFLGPHLLCVFAFISSPAPNKVHNHSHFTFQP